MNFFRGLTKFFRTDGRTFVGKDHLGNKYYIINPPNQPQRRLVDYSGDGFHEGIAGLPNLWRSWILKLRELPPTPQEIENEFARQKIMKQRIAQVDARNREAVATEGLSPDLRPFLKQLTGKDIGNQKSEQLLDQIRRGKLENTEVPHNFEGLPSSVQQQTPQAQLEKMDVDALKRKTEREMQEILKKNL